MVELGFESWFNFRVSINSSDFHLKIQVLYIRLHVTVKDVKLSCQILHSNLKPNTSLITWHYLYLFSADLELTLTTSVCVVLLYVDSHWLVL